MRLLYAASIFLAFIIINESGPTGKMICHMLSMFAVGWVIADIVDVPRIRSIKQKETK